MSNPWPNGLTLPFGGYIPDYHHKAEGFVIGLARTKRTDGRCGATDPHFQFQSGRTVKHKDILEEYVPSWLKSIYHNTLAHVLEVLKLSKEIEDFDYQPCPPVDDPNYKLWASENKHANYFSRNECEATLLGWHIPGVEIFGVDTSMTIGGLEECEPGRPAYNLSNSVELITDRMKGEPDTAERALYTWNEGWDSYFDAARGNTYMENDLFHVPDFNIP